MLSFLKTRNLREAAAPAKSRVPSWEQETVPSRDFGNQLVEEGLITQGQLEEALALRRKRGGFIGGILAELGYAELKEIVPVLSRHLDIGYLNMLDHEVSKEALELIPKEICEAYLLLPIDRVCKRLTVAMVDPLDTVALERIRRACPDVLIKPVLCDPRIFRNLAAWLFPRFPEMKDAAPAPGEGAASRSGLKPDPRDAGPAKGAERLGELLLREGLITRAQWDKAFAIYRQRGGFVGQWLVDLGFIAHDMLTSFLMKKLNLPFLNISDYDIDPEVLKIIPKEICLAHHLLPLDRLGRILTVAMVDPLDEEAIEKVRRLCPDLHIERIMCDWRHFTQVAARRSPKEDVRELDLETLGLHARRSADNVDASAQSGKTFSAIQAIVKEAIQGTMQTRESLPRPDSGRQQQEVRAEEPSPHATSEAPSAPGTDPLPPVIEMSLTGYDIRKEVLALIPRDICLKYRVLPIEKLGRVLAVAMVEPRDAVAVHEVHVRCPDLRIKAVPCPAEEFDRLAAQYLATDD